MMLNVNLEASLGPKVFMSCDAMSFAAELGQMAFDAKEAQVKRWVEVTLIDFRTQCKKRARKSKSSCTVDFKLPKLPSAARNQAICLLDEKLNELGFEDFDTTRCKFSKNLSGLQVKASWKVEPKEKIRQVEQTAADSNSQGLVGPCPICHEDDHLVALVPCGHSVCKKCHQCGRLHQCPVCRTNLTGATSALFVG